MGQRQLVGDVVVHGDEDLPGLHGVGQKDLGPDRSPLRLDHNRLVGPDVLPRGVVGIDFDVDLRRASCRKTGDFAVRVADATARPNPGP